MPKSNHLMNKFVSSALSTGKAKEGVSGFDSHVPLTKCPDTMIRGCDGNESMRRKFEAMIRQGQDDICKAIEEVTRDVDIYPFCLSFLFDRCIDL